MQNRLSALLLRLSNRLMSLMSNNLVAVKQCSKRAATLPKSLWKFNSVLCSLLYLVPHMLDQARVLTPALKHVIAGEIATKNN